MGVRLSIRSADGRPLDAGLDYAFEQARVVLGRSVGADVRLPHLTVSEHHATLLADNDGHALIDEGSTNGTFVNGKRLVAQRRRRLADGDRIEVGVFTLAFEAGALVTRPLTVEHTAELARRLYRESRGGGAAAGPRLVVLDGPLTGRSLAIPAAPSRCLVGRDDTCQLALPDPDVSREHMEVLHDLEGIQVRNLESKNGIELDGSRIECQRLKDGDELRLGATRLLFEEPAQAPIEHMTGEPDLKLSTRPAPTEPAQPAPAPEASAPPAARRPRPRAAGSEADLIIYALAAIVFAVSMAGLVLLMR